MPLDYQMASINLTGGIETKSDNKLQVQSKLLVLRDAVFTESDIEKRAGYDAVAKTIINGTSFTTPKMTKAYKDRLTIAADNKFYDYSEASGASKEVGQYNSIAVSNSLVSSTNENQRSSTSIIYQNYVITAFDSWNNLLIGSSGTTISYMTIQDLETGSVIAANIPVSPLASQTICPKLVLIAGTQPAVFYYQPGVGLCYALITFSGSTISVGAEVVLSAAVQLYGELTEINWASYDVIKTESGASSPGCIIAWSSSAGGNPIELRTINAAGSVTQTSSIAAAGFCLPITLCQDPTNFNVWVYYANAASAVMPAASATIKINYRSQTLASTGTPRTMLSNQAYVRQIAAAPVNSTNQYMWYSNVPKLNGSNADIPKPTISLLTVSTTTQAVTQNIGNVDLYTKPFKSGSEWYLPTVFYSATQYCGFLLKLVDATDTHGYVMAGKFMVGTAEAANTALDIQTSLTTGGHWWRYPGGLGTSNVYNSTQFIFSSGIILESASPISGPSPSYVNAKEFLMGTCLVAFDFAYADSFQAKEANGVLVLNGSIVQSYDGVGTTELGFNNTPELDYTLSGAGGTIPAGTYTYYAIFQWYDGQGNLYQSGVSPPITITTTGSTSSVSIHARDICGSTKGAYSQVQPVVLFYRASSSQIVPAYLTQVESQGYFGFAATIDAHDIGQTIRTDLPIYTAGTAILPNDPPPPSMTMWLSNNRIWMIDSENPETDVWYSKTFSRRNGVNFSADLVYVVDPKLGDIVAGNGMDEKTVLLKERGLMYFIGDGANDSGTGASFSAVQTIPTDVGCSGSKGVILIPSGLIFRANDNKGIYMLTRGVQVGYFGADVEDFNAQDITAAEMIADKQQVRFLTSSGYSLLFDYFYNQWSTFSNHAGLSSTIWKGNYVYVRSDGLVYAQNNTGTYLDGSTAYSVYATTAWMKAAQIQNLERIRMVETLGSWLGASGHSLKISANYDWDSTSTLTTTAYPFADSTEFFQYRAWLPKQKANAIQFIIEEVTTGASGEFVRIANFAMEIGLKKGLNKLPATRSVG